MFLPTRRHHNVRWQWFFFIIIQLTQAYSCYFCRGLSNTNYWLIGRHYDTREKKKKLFSPLTKSFYRKEGLLWGGEHDFLPGTAETKTFKLKLDNIEVIRLHKKLHCVHETDVMSKMYNVHKVRHKNKIKWFCGLGSGTFYIPSILSPELQ